MTTTVTREYVQVDNGPSREQLFDALKYAYHKPKAFVVSFSGTLYKCVQVADHHSKRNYGSGSFIAKINRIEHEDGSGRSFNIAGYTRKGEHFEGYYHTGTREGYIEIISK